MHLYIQMPPSSPVSEPLSSHSPSRLAALAIAVQSFGVEIGKISFLYAIQSPAICGLVDDSGFIVLVHANLVPFVVFSYEQKVPVACFKLKFG